MNIQETGRKIKSMVKANIPMGKTTQILLNRNGDYYEGSWHTDKMNGRGKYTTAKGEVYEGIFRNHRFVG